MISEFFLNIVFNIVAGMLELLPDAAVDISVSSFSGFLDIVRVAAYLLPLSSIVALISVIITLTVVRIVVAFIKMIWDLLPIV